MSETVDVLIVGAGPAGLAAAVEIARAGFGVRVVDRERELGGVPRHCFHLGFGWFDLRRMLSGPGYARRRVELAQRAGAELQSETTVLGWSGDRTLKLTSPRGLEEVSARAVLLATGCRERPRAARLVAGDRPRGVLTTGSLQQLVHLEHLEVGKRAVVVGAEHVSFSAVQTLRGANVQVAAMVTEHPMHQTHPLYRMLVATGRVPILCSTEIARVIGRGRVEGVELRDRTSGARQTIACDTVVFTGEFTPEHELARLGGLAIDPGTHGPAVDGALRTSREGVFAAGNLLHGAEMADTAALEGRAAAREMIDYLRTGNWPKPETRIPITVAAPLAWISPNVITVGTPPPRGHFVLRTREVLSGATVELRQGDRVLASRRFRRLVPHHWFHLPGELDLGSSTAHLSLSVAGKA
jgi:thioredoxin reductase